jgi:hypothetical protein
MKGFVFCLVIISYIQAMEFVGYNEELVIAPTAVALSLEKFDLKDKSLSDFKELRRYFFKGFLEITPQNFEDIGRTALSYPENFSRYNGGIFINGWNASSITESELLNLLHGFTDVTKFKVNILWDTDDYDTSEIICRTIQFFPNLSELFLANCRLTDTSVHEIIESLVHPCSLRTLDLTNNLVSEEVLIMLGTNCASLINLKTGLDEFKLPPFPKSEKISNILAEMRSTEIAPEQGLLDLSFQEAYAKVVEIRLERMGFNFHTVTNTPHHSLHLFGRINRPCMGPDQQFYILSNANWRSFHRGSGNRNIDENLLEQKMVIQIKEFKDKIFHEQSKYLWEITGSYLIQDSKIEMFMQQISQQREENIYQLKLEFSTKNRSNYNIMPIPIPTSIYFQLTRNELDRIRLCKILNTEIGQKLLEIKNFLQNPTPQNLKQAARIQEYLSETSPHDTGRDFGKNIRIIKHIYYEEQLDFLDSACRSKKLTNQEIDFLLNDISYKYYEDLEQRGAFRDF